MVGLVSWTCSNHLWIKWTWAQWTTEVSGTLFSASSKLQIPPPKPRNSSFTSAHMLRTHSTLGHGRGSSLSNKHLSSKIGFPLPTLHQTPGSFYRKLLYLIGFIEHTKGPFIFWLGGELKIFNVFWNNLPVSDEVALVKFMNRQCKSTTEKLR